jgi:hypothetical protein
MSFSVFLGCKDMAFRQNKIVFGGKFSDYGDWTARRRVKKLRVKN